MPDEPVVSPPPQKKRIDAIDAFRGFTILGMIFVIQVAGYHHLPLTFPQWGSAPVSTFKHASEDDEPEEWAFWEGTEHSTIYYKGEVTARRDDGKYDVRLTEPPNAAGTSFSGVRIRHAKPLAAGDPVIAVLDPESDARFQGVGNGCTFTDWVAPFFVFIVGLCIPLSRQRRGSEWWKHVGSRTLGLILLGVIYISLILKLSYWWGILQAIGVAYFMGAVFMRFPAWGRWIAVAVIAFIHGWMSWHFDWWLTLDVPGKEGALTIANPGGDPLQPLTVHCTPWASISYGLITIVGTLLGDAIVTRNPKTIARQSLLVGAVFTAAGILLHTFQAPMNKDYVSPAYSIFTSGLGAFFFLGFYWVMDVWNIKKWAWPLTVFGANALLAYFLQPVVRIFIVALGLYPFLRGHAGWSGMWAGFLWSALLWCVVLWFNKKNIYWKL